MDILQLEFRISRYIYEKIPLASWPHYISFLKPNYSWPVIHLVVFSHLWPGALHISLQIHKIQPMWHFCAALHAFADYCGRIFARNFRKATRNSDSSLDCLLTASLCCVLLWTAISSRLFSSALLCQLTLWDLSSFLHFRSRGRSHPQALCVSSAPKQTKRLSDRRTHTPTQRMANIASYIIHGSCTNKG